MQTLLTFLTELLPIIGVIVGASLQYFLSNSGEKRKQLETSRNQAYVDYLRSVAQIAQVSKGDSRKRAELLAMAADAKTRISVYGSASVLKALAVFELGSPVLNSSDSMSRFLKLCNEMRLQSVGKSEIVHVDDLNIILFGHKD